MTPLLRAFGNQLHKTFNAEKAKPCIYIATANLHRWCKSNSESNLIQKRKFTGSGNNDSNSHSGKSVGRTILALTGTLVGAVLYWKWKNNCSKSSYFGKVFAAEVEPGKVKDGLPTFTKEDVAAHNSKETGIWVIFGNGVYDVTQYVQSHPGGNKILLAAGKSIEPYWSVYSVHKTEEIYEILESLRIGNIIEVSTKKSKEAGDPYRADPERSPVLIPSSEKPYNAEPPLEMLADVFLTPNHLFFVRNHLPVPCMKLEGYCLKLELSPGKSTSIKIEELRTKFPKKSVTAVIQCAGNRRGEMVKVKPVKGLNWGSAAISNAKWSGVSLEDLLKHYKVDIDTINTKYIVFEGMDKTPEGEPYGASIPIELAKMLKKEIIIAYEMNGTSIPRDHGFPVRVIIPGVVGARQVKWLSKIYFSAEESTSHWQRKDYKGFNSSVDWDNVNFDDAVSITQIPVNSAICEPVEGAEVDINNDEVLVKGYAFSGGGRGIIRVDVSADGGKTWIDAKLKPNGQTPYTSYSWTLWEAYVPLPKGVSETVLIAKAVDVSYNVQPDTVEGIWNLRGVLSNAWHRVNVKLVKGADPPKEQPKTALN